MGDGMMENNDKIYFLPGDLVRFRKDLPNSPLCW